MALNSTILFGPFFKIEVSNDFTSPVKESCQIVSHRKVQKYSDISPIMVAKSDRTAFRKVHRLSICTNKELNT